jgi:predicted nucleotidyltransferase
MKPDEALLRHRDAVLEAAQRHGAHHVRVFGSVARGEARDDSDIDLLVEFDRERSLLDHAALLNDLEDLLGCKVDVVDEGGLRKEFRDVILADLAELPPPTR